MAKASPKRKKILIGLSEWEKPQRKRQKPTCKERGKKIEYQSACIRHSQMKSQQDRYLQVDQYHCNRGCFLGLPSAMLSDFAKTDWNSYSVCRMAEKMRGEGRRRKPP
eukprot:scaffold20489_cov159-Amphora_coffeaeformis.AAC.1